MDEPYVIWSDEHGAWWKPGRWGYTVLLSEAGRYSRDEAYEIVDKANRYSRIVNERAFRLSEAPGALPSYQCPRCGRISHHPVDAAERYCGYCHAFEAL